MAGKAIRFTPERRRTWLELVESGQSQKSANMAVHVSDRTIAEWLRVGREQSEGEKFEFAQAYDAIKPARRKRAPAELVKQERGGGLDVPTLVALLEAEALNGSVQAMKYLLERPWERKDVEEAKPQGKSILDELSALRERKNTG
jgi:hypothetical protein